jgi:hypothetical protein
MAGGITAAVIGGTAILGGAYMSSKASKSAAQTQANAANQATASQEQALQAQLATSAPYSQAGLTAQNRLMSLLGLQNPNFGPGNMWNEAAYLRQNPDVAAAVARGDFGSGLEHYNANGMNEGRELGFTPERSADFGKYANAEFGGIKGFDPASLMQDFGGIKGFDPASLMQDFGGIKGFDPASLMKNFTPADFAAGMDPGYAFRVSEGNKALNASAAARGGLISGNALKAAQDYGQAAGSQEYTNAFNRYQANRAVQGQEYANAYNRFGANRAFQGQEYANAYNRFGANRAFQGQEFGNAFNRFQTERSNTLAPYQALTGQGQAAAAGQAANIGNFGNAQASNIIGAGNAQAAGQIGSANAYTNAIGQGVGMYQTNQLLNRFAPQNTSAYSNPSANTPMATADQGYYGPGLNY